MKTLGFLTALLAAGLILAGIWMGARHDGGCILEVHEGVKEWRC